MLFSWMKSLIFYLILSGIAVNLSPGKNYKRYINFFTGLVVIVIATRPILYVLNIKYEGTEAITEDLNYYLMKNVSLKEQDNIYDYYDMSIEESIKRFLDDRGYEVSNVTVLTGEDKQIVGLYVYYRAKEGDEPNAEINIKNYISEVYKVSVDNIYIVRR